MDDSSRPLLSSEGVGFTKESKSTRKGKISNFSLNNLFEGGEEKENKCFEYEESKEKKFSFHQLIYQYLSTVIPSLKWMRHYTLQEFNSDLLAGLTVGIMLIPQSMSYAKLAGLDPIYGLYSSFVPVLTYAFFGSSRQLAVGPVALVSLLTKDALTGVVDDVDVDSDSDEGVLLYTHLAILLALMVGVLEMFIGLFRLGWLIRFLSHSVISGFTSGAAIILGFSVLKDFFSVTLSQTYSTLLPLLLDLFSKFFSSSLNWQTLSVGLLALTYLLVMKESGKRNKKLGLLGALGPFTTVIIFTLFVKFANLEDVSVIGSVSAGLPSLSFQFEFQYLTALFPYACTITAVGVLESMGIARALAAQNSYDFDSSQELFGLGITNVLGSLFSSYPTTGSFSRSAVSNEVGSRTNAFGFVVAFLVFLTLKFFTSLLYYIPQVVLSAIILSAVFGLVDYNEAIFLWKVEKKDFVLWMISFFGTLICGIEIGVMIAVLISLLFVIYESANPHMAVLGRLPGTTIYRNVLQYADAYTYDKIVVVRIDSPMYFANISYIKERLRKFELRNDANNRLIKYIIIDLSPVTYVDSTALHALKAIHKEYSSRSIQLAFSNPNSKVMGSLVRAKLHEAVGKEFFFVRVHDAVQVCKSLLSEKSSSLPPDPNSGDDSILVFIEEDNQIK